MPRILKGGNNWEAALAYVGIEKFGFKREEVKNIINRLRARKMEPPLTQIENDSHRGIRELYNTGKGMGDEHAVIKWAIGQYRDLIIDPETRKPKTGPFVVHLSAGPWGMPGDPVTFPDEDT